MEYQEKGHQLIKYFHKVRDLSTRFKYFEVKYIPKKKSFKADILSNLSNIEADEIYTL